MSLDHLLCNRVNKTSRKNSSFLRKLVGHRALLLKLQRDHWAGINLDPNEMGPAAKLEEAQPSGATEKIGPIQTSDDRVASISERLATLSLMDGASGGT